VYLHVGLLDEVKLEIDTALKINPGNTLARFRYGVIDLYKGDYERAYSFFNTTSLDKNPTLWGFQMATVQFRLGRVDEATRMVDEALAGSPNDEGGVWNSVRAMILAKAGNRAGAEAAITQAIKFGEPFGHFHHTAYNIASAYALLGERAKAVRWLQDAADDGFPCYPLFATDTQLDNLRGDAAFTALMTRLKAEWEERKRTMPAT
jgi:tetratricopeptide (TPR) repeat protein